MVEENKKQVERDVSGKDRFAWNVITSWVGYLFVLIPGFVLPRMISDLHGEVALGIWDFCWAFVNYLKLSNFGIGASVSRFVAKYKAEGDIERLNGAVSTIFIFQIFVAAFVMTATIVLSYVLPDIYEEKLGDFASEVHWVVLCLGGSLALYFIIDVFRGVTTGVHRWDVHNAIIAATHALMFITMAGALYLGGGLVEISFAYFSVSVISEIVRVLSAYKVCPELKISRSNASLKHAKKMGVFGAKTVLNNLPQVLIIQSTNILVMGALGPAVLAVLMRPIALMRHASAFILKFAFVLTPMAGSLQATKETHDLREFMLETNRYSVAFTLPIVLFLMVFGDRILYLWMGEGFDVWPLIIILSAGYFLPISQSSISRILVGLNAHGKAALISIAVVVLTYAVGVIWIEQIGWSLQNAAILISISLTLANGIVLPVVACRRMDVSASVYLRRVFVVPMILGALYFAVLVACRVMITEVNYLNMIWGFVLGGAVISMTYWRWIASDIFREKIVRFVKSKLGRATA